MARRRGLTVFDRLMGLCLGLLTAAVAVYMAVRLIQSVAGALIGIGVVIGGVAILGFALRLWWRRNAMNRW